MKQLEGLDLPFNLIRELRADQFESMTNLTRSNLHGNSIESLPAGLFRDLHNLKALFITENQISDLTLLNGNLRYLSNLDELELCDNKICVLPKDFFTGMSNLKILDLGSNSIERIESGVFDELVNLDKLGLSMNRLETIPADLFAKLSKLDKLNLSANKIHDLRPGSFSGLSNLKWLYLASNVICELKNVAFVIQ
jgi:Leucine-rich repeat (LRR) protein